MTISVEALLDAHIRRIEKPRPPDGLWHPSSIFGCERQAVYEVRGTTPSDVRENRSRRILRMGTTIHEIVQTALTNEAAGVVVYNEVAVDIPALNITGHCDSLLMHSPDDWELLEFKSISPNGMKYGGLPKPEHVNQARTYAYGLRHIGGVVPGPTIAFADDEDLPIPPLGDKLQRIRIAYFSRDDLRVEEFPLLVDEEWEAELEDKIARLNRYRDDGEALPPRLPLERGKKNWLCAGFCQFRSKCWTNDQEGIEL